MFKEKLPKVNSELNAKIIRANGTSTNLLLGNDNSWWLNAWNKCKKLVPIFSTIGLASFIAWATNNPETFEKLLSPLMAVSLGAAALVTTAGVNYMAADFLSGSSARINAFNFHDCGTGTTAAAIGDTALVTPAGTARVSGTQSNPTANQYRTIATVSFTGSLAITEWGLFSASSAGTLWDRRVFSAINVANGDSIQFNYTLTIPAGGS